MLQVMRFLGLLDQTSRSSKGTSKDEYLKKTYRKFLQIWNRCPFLFKGKLICFLWSKVQDKGRGECGLIYSYLKGILREFLQESLVLRFISFLNYVACGDMHVNYNCMCAKASLFSVGTVDPCMLSERERGSKSALLSGVSSCCLVDKAPFEGGTPDRQHFIQSLVCLHKFWHRYLGWMGSVCFAELI